MPLVHYSLLRLAILGGCWALLQLAGLHPLIALGVAALVAWGVSYVTLPGPRDAAARWLAERDAERRARGGRPSLSARAQADADAEDAAVGAADDERTGPAGGRPGPGDEQEGTAGSSGAQSASPSPSSTP